MTSLEIYSDVIQLIRALRPTVESIGRHDNDLGRQMRRALTSIPLNIAEGAKLNDGNGRARFLTAMGSSNEVAAILETSEALGYVDGVGPGLLDELDRIARTLNRLAPEALTIAPSPPSPLPRRWGGLGGGGFDRRCARVLRNGRAPRRRGSLRVTAASGSPAFR